MKFINLRKEALKASEIGKCSNSTVKVIRRESAVYLYKHAAIVNTFTMNRKNINELANYINEHQHISKIIFPNYAVSNILIYKLKIAGFFEKLNRKVRITVIWNYRKKAIGIGGNIIKENNIRLYNFVNRPLSYIIKDSDIDIALINCEFRTEFVDNTIFPIAVLNYTTF